MGAQVCFECGEAIDRELDVELPTIESVEGRRLSRRAVLERDVPPTFCGDEQAKSKLISLRASRDRAVSALCLFA
jgi:hypothetical protein